MPFNVGWNVLVMRESSNQGLVIRMRKIIVPIEAFVPAIYFVALRCNDACLKIYLFPNAQSDTA